MRSVPARSRGSLLTASRPLLRAFAFAGIAVPVSLVGHLAGGGAIPDEAALLLAVALVTAAYRMVLASRERSWPAISVALGCAEFALHTLFDSGAHGLAQGGLAASMPPGMEMPASGAGHVHLAPGLLMTAGHAIAAVVLGWFLRNGERALWSLARRATVRVGGFVGPLFAVLALLGLVPIAPTRIEPRCPVPAGDARRRRYRTTGAVLWRGPPARPPAFTV